MRARRAKLLRKICGYDPHGERKMVRMNKTGQIINVTKLEYRAMKNAVGGGR